METAGQVPYTNLTGLRTGAMPLAADDKAIDGMLTCILPRLLTNWVAEN